MDTGMEYEPQQFQDALERFFGEPKTLSDDDLKQLSTVSSSLGARARLRRSGHVEPKTEDQRKFEKGSVSYRFFSKWLTDWFTPMLATYRLTHQAGRRSRSRSLEARVVAIEARPALKYVGVHEAGSLYREGCLCTVAAGSGSRPETRPAAWRR